MKRISLKGGDEYDAFSHWRRQLVAFRRPGEAKRAKRSYNRRFRRASRDLAKHEASQSSSR